jgi:lysophospholipase L1-like esterase
VVKASEGQALFDGILLEPGGKLTKPVIPAHRIEFVGDSITAGYKISGADGFEDPVSHDAKASYGWLIGERLDAEVRLIAVTGSGLVHNYGVVPSSSRTMPLSYPYLHRASIIANDWSWKPEIIVVNVGTNDLGPPAATPSDTFQAAYNNFLSAVRGFNPTSLIVALQPFGVGGGTVPVYPAEIRAAVETRHQAGDSRVMYVDTSGWLGAGDLTDGAHPNIKGHSKAADLLAPILWKALTAK